MKLEEHIKQLKHMKNKIEEICDMDSMEVKELHSEITEEIYKSKKKLYKELAIDC